MGGLDEFVGKHKVYGNNHTHLSIVAKQKYRLEYDDMDEFYDTYAKRLTEEQLGMNNGRQRPLSISERQEKYSPILNDTDIKIPFDPKRKGQRLYQPTDVREMIRVYQDFLKTHMREYKAKVGVCFVLEKSKSRHVVSNNKEYLKDGFHLHFPNAYLSDIQHSEVLIPYVKQEVTTRGLFKQSLPRGVDPVSLIDNSYYRQNWLMYGSVKEAGAESYKVTKVYDDQMEEIDWYHDILKMPEVSESNRIESIIETLTSSECKEPVSPDERICKRTKGEDLSPGAPIPSSPSSPINSPGSTNTSGGEGETQTKALTLASVNEAVERLIDINKRIVKTLSVSPIEKESIKFKDSIVMKISSNWDGSRPRVNEEKQYDKFMSVPDALKLCYKLVMECLDVKRSEEYESWMAVGRALYTVGDGCREAYQIWLKFSERTTKGNFDPLACQYNWKSFKEGYVTMGTIIYYARQDNHMLCDQILFVDKEDSLLYTSLNGGHSDIATMIYRKHKDFFVCADTDKKVWYKYNGHGWNFANEEHDIYRLVIDLAPLYMREFKKLVAEINEGMGDIESEEELGLYKAQMKVKNYHAKKLSEIHTKLKSTNFIVNIVRLCRGFFYSDNFVEKLDSDTHLIRFTNGVLDLRAVEFRDGKPDDYLFKSTKYDFREVPDDDEGMILLKDHLSKVYVNERLRQYYLEYCANLLIGGNRSKILLILSGLGDNGKTVNIDLLKLIFGEYFITFPTTLLTGKRTQSSAATPDTANCKGARVAVIQEPDGRDRINTGMGKELTGNDSIYVRPLYKSPIEIKPMFKLMIMCNRLPKLTSDDNAIWNRIRVLNHESNFTKDMSIVPDEEEDQRHKKVFAQDPEFCMKYPQMKQPFMWLLFQEFKRMQIEGKMLEPKEITEDTIKYRESIDTYIHYIHDNIAFSSDEEDFLTEDDIYEDFKAWMRESNPQEKTPGKLDVFDNIRLKWNNRLRYDKGERKWFGIRYKRGVIVE